MASSSALPTLSIKDALTESWEKLKLNLGTLLSATVILIVVSFVLSYVRDSLNPAQKEINGTYILLSLGIWFINTILGIGFVRLALQTLRNKKPSINDLGHAFSNGTMFWQYILSQIFVFVVTTLGTILFIIPGVYLGLTYALAQFFIVDKELTAKEALNESKRAMQGNRLRLLGLILILGLINLGGIIVVGVGLLVTIPLSVLAITHAYQQLTSSQPALEPAA